MLLQLGAFCRHVLVRIIPLVVIVVVPPPAPVVAAATLLLHGLSFPELHVASAAFAVGGALSGRVALAIAVGVAGLLLGGLGVVLAGGLVSVGFVFFFFNLILAG